MGALKTAYLALAAMALAAQGAPEGSSGQQEPAPQKAVVDGSWAFVQEDGSCAVSLNLISRARPAVLVKVNRTEGWTLLSVIGIEAKNSRGREVPLFLEVDGRMAASSDKGEFMTKGEPAYLWRFSPAYGDRLTKAKTLEISFGLEDSMLIPLSGGDAARNAMLSCLKPETAPPVASSAPQSPAPPRKADRRFCKFGYCPCDRTDPDYGGVDSQICRTREAGMPVSDEWMIIGANARDARRQIREFNGN
ncbi:hypothetical protein [Erythrobacter tepidarius]|uniref:hypothetical protein n=1 Tax=Erythrobacter tepidarius TaxID=60454 RepID=UPI001180A630|nr:hypothetical protein [Erythrobacter tepidarius]